MTVGIALLKHDYGRVNNEMEADIYFINILRLGSRRMVL